MIFRIKEIVISGISDSDNFSLVWLELSTYIGFGIVRGVISIINPYAVTELLLGLKLMSTQVEIWVLGCFIYEIRSGQKPFHMESPVEPAEAMADVARTLGKLPENWVLIPFNWCGQYGCGMKLLPLSNTEGPAMAAKKLGEDSPSPEDQFGKVGNMDQASDSNIIHFLILSGDT